MFPQISMSATITKINAMKMQHVQIQMVITLVPVMMDLWVMVSLVQVNTAYFCK